MFADESWDEADRWVDDWQGRIEDRLARAQALAARCSRLIGAAETGGGLVRVTVDSSGALVDLHLDEEVRRNSARWIAGQVLLAIRQARYDLVRRADDAARESGDLDTSDGRALLAAMTDRYR